MKILGKAWIKLLVFVISLRIIENVLYDKKFGPLSSSAGDIWFFIGVARGHQRLLGGDPLQWFLPLLGNCRLEVIFGTLLVLSNLFHLLAVLLLFGFLHEAYRDKRAAFWAAAAYACFQTSCVFCTGSFHHQQEALPVLIGLIWAGYRFLKTSDTRLRIIYGIISGLLALIGLFIGPDLWPVLAAASPCLLLWKLRRPKNPAMLRIFETFILAFWVTTLCLLAPAFENSLFSLAQKFRGIDLAAQRQLNAGDLLPFTRSNFYQNYSWMAYGFFALAIWAWSRDRFVELAFLFTTIIFAMLAVRFYFLAEVALAILLGWALARGISLHPAAQKLAGPILVVIFISLEIWRGFSCFYPGILASTLSKAGPSDLNHEKPIFHIILCTPTYGFLVREAVEKGRPISDWHHLKDNDVYMKLLAKPAIEAAPEIGKKGVNYLFLTSHDFSETIEPTADGSLLTGTYASGGLEKALAGLSPEDLQRTLVSQAFNPVFQQFPIHGISLVTAAEDPATHLKAVLYRIE